MSVIPRSTRYAVPPHAIPGVRPPRGRASRRRWGWLASLSLPVVSGLLLTACDNTFDPLAPGGPPFSVFGYLDPAADIQWIRVNELHTLLEAPPGPSGVAATLENLGSGATVQLRDSTLAFPTSLGAAPAYAHDFWTSERIEPGATYRFQVRGSGGALGEATVRIPPLYRAEVWISEPPYGPSTTSLSIEGLKQLVFLRWQTIYHDECNPADTSRRVQPMDPGGDSVTRLVAVHPDTDVAIEDCGTRKITKQAVEIVGSEDAWPFGQNYSTWQLKPEDLSSSVSSSLGFIGGVLTRTVRIESCTFVAPSPTETYCKLRYDSTTATLRGDVRSACPMQPDSIRVELRELDPPPPEPARIRTAHTDMSRVFEIAALRPGIRHLLTITAGTNYFPYTDTLRFTAGQQAAYSATLDRVGLCPGS